METSMAIVRLVHIAAGMLALFVAPVAMATTKGGPAHRRWGKVYFWMMAVVAATAIPLSFYRPALFFALIAVFSFYGAFYGYRALYRKRRREGAGATGWDWAAAIVVLIVSGGLIVLGLVEPPAAWERPGTVAVVFGVIGAAFAGRTLWRFARPSGDRQAWWFNHMGGMLGSYIATVTAFSVVNFTALPITVRWLWPTAIGVPLIFAWVAYEKARLRRPAHSGSPV
jgi:uncharacterized membrane protein